MAALAPAVGQGRRQAPGTVAVCLRQTAAHLTGPRLAPMQQHRLLEALPAALERPFANQGAFGFDKGACTRPHCALT